MSVVRLAGMFLSYKLYSCSNCCLRMILENKMKVINKLQKYVAQKFMFQYFFHPRVNPRYIAMSTDILKWSVADKESIRRNHYNKICKILSIKNTYQVGRLGVNIPRQWQHQLWQLSFQQDRQDKQPPILAFCKYHVDMAHTALPDRVAFLNRTRLGIPVIYKSKLFMMIIIKYIPISQK